MKTYRIGFRLKDKGWKYYEIVSMDSSAALEHMRYCHPGEVEMRTITYPDNGEETEAYKLLSTSSAFYRSPNYGTYYKDGIGHIVPFPWYPDNSSPVGELPRVEMVLPREHGFTVVISHGGIICPDDTFIQFPKYATEKDFIPAFNRLMAWINQNYVWQPGLPAFLHGD